MLLKFYEIESPVEQIKYDDYFEVVIFTLNLKFDIYSRWCDVTTSFGLLRVLKEHFRLEHERNMFYNFHVYNRCTGISFQLSPPFKSINVDGLTSCKSTKGGKFMTFHNTG